MRAALAGGTTHAGGLLSRIRPPRAIGRVALVLFGLTALPAPAALAQQNDFFFFLRPPANVPQQQPQRQRRAPERSWWGGNLFQPYQQPDGRPAQRSAPRTQSAAPQPQHSAPPSRKRVPAAPVEAEGEVFASAADAQRDQRPVPTQFVLVLGDRMADQIADGLADAYVTDDKTVAVIGSIADGSGFLASPADWIAKAPAALAAAQANVTVVALGSEDIRPIKDGELTVEPMTERWMELYARRVDEVLAFLREKARRVVVVGLAPAADDGLNADYARLNDLLRTRAARAGLVFTDVWDGFADEDGKYFVFGPAVDGQRRRLRLNDGLRFTRAGADKLAFFVQKDLNRFLSDSAKPANGADDLDARSALSLAGGPQGDRERGDTAAKPVSLAASDAARALRDGVPPDPVRGRADDFSWPPPEPPAESPPPAAAGTAASPSAAP